MQLKILSLLDLFCNVLCEQIVFVLIVSINLQYHMTSCCILCWNMLGEFIFHEEILFIKTLNILILQFTAEVIPSAIFWMRNQWNFNLCRLFISFQYFYLPPAEIWKLVLHLTYICVGPFLMELTGPPNLTLLCHLQQWINMAVKTVRFFDLSKKKKKKL